MNNNKARIIFDLDGTLVDSAPSLVFSANLMLEELGMAPVNVETYKTFIGRGLNKQIESLMAYVKNGNTENLEKHIERFKEIYYSNPLNKTNLFPNVKSCLERLQDDGHAMAICTQKFQEPAEAILKGLKIFDCFSGFSYGDTLDVMKPNENMVYSAVKFLEPGRLIYVGDSEVDSKTAENSKAKFFLFLGGYRNSPVSSLKVHQAFDNFSKLPELISSELAI